MVLWFVILISVQLCSSIVVRINPVVIIKYKRNETSGDAGQGIGITTPGEPSSNTTSPAGVTRHTVNFLNTSSTSGTFLVDKRYGSHLFWWFFRSENDSSTDPVIVWLQGQPNASSLYGLFDEHGPFAINHFNKTVFKRTYSWNSKFNVLYLDLFTSSGYSYAKHPKGYSLRLEDVAKNLIRALHMFFATYPELLGNDLYLSGESMSGKYMFVAAHGIFKSNPMMRRKLNLKGLLIGNGFMDPMQLSQYRENLFRMGILPLKEYVQMYPDLPTIDSHILTGNYTEAIMLWRKLYYAKINQAGYSSMYDVRDINAFWNSLVPEVATSREIRKLLRVGDRKFNMGHHCAYFIGEAFRPITKVLAEVLNHYKVLFYTGQFDMLVPYIHTANFLDNLEWEGVQRFSSSKHDPWIMDETLLGYWKKCDTLTHVLLLNAGHAVGASQPRYLLEMVKRFVYDEVEDRPHF